MVSTPTTSLRLEKQGLGEHVNTWGTSGINTALDMLDAAISGQASIAVTGDFTLTSVNYTADQARNAVLTLSGTPAAAFTVTTPGAAKLYVVRNGTGKTATFTTGSGVTVAVPTGRIWLIQCDGTDWVGACLPRTLDENVAAAGSVNFGSQRAVSLADPVSAQDGVTKNYVDTVAITAAGSSAAAAASAAAALASETTASAAAATAVATMAGKLAVWGGTAGGTANALTLTPSPALAAYTAGLTVLFLPASANTGAVTINVSGLGAVALTRLDGGALIGSELVAGEVTEIVHDGTAFRLLIAPPPHAFNFSAGII